MDTDDAIKDAKTARHFRHYVDPTMQTIFCQKCAQPVYLVSRDMRECDYNNADWGVVEDVQEICIRCMNSIIQNKVGCDE